MPIYLRTRRLLGDDVLQAVRTTRVALFGLGGVGSWCAESLVRSGVSSLTLVDADVVAPSNLNRQLQATLDTVGEPKTEALARRLWSIAPDADLTLRAERYTASTADAFDLSAYDYVIDCIDALADKALLIHRATRSRATFFSSMGAALKIDPTRIAVAEFWQVKGCPLAAALRRKFRRDPSLAPGRKFRCVYSDELLPNLGPAAASDRSDVIPKGQTNGSLAPITGAFGFTLAGLLLTDLYRRHR